MPLTHEERSKLIVAAKLANIYNEELPNKGLLVYTLNSPMTIHDAAFFCQHLEIIGIKGWRLPTLAELFNCASNSATAPLSVLPLAVLKTRVSYWYCSDTAWSKIKTTDCNTILEKLAFSNLKLEKKVMAVNDTLVCKK